MNSGAKSSQAREIAHVDSRKQEKAGQTPGAERQHDN